jgi:hypothetical protein
VQNEIRTKSLLGSEHSPSSLVVFNLYRVNSPQLAAISWSIPSDTPLLAAGFFIKKEIGSRR